MSRRLHIVDVFTHRPCAGNQLAVVLGAQGLRAPQMQSFAREMNFSETSFVTSERPLAGAWPVRIYTPTSELPFAGHPVLGTAHVIRQALLAGKAERVTLALAAGRIPVVMERVGRSELYWMRQPRAVIGKRLPRSAVAAALGLGVGDLQSAFPVLEVSTGLPHLIVPLRSRRALSRVAPDNAALEKLLAPCTARSVLCFSNSAKGAPFDYAVRVVSGAALGVTEDAATGSGNGCLAAWLVETRYRRDDALEVTVEQGTHLGRPSLLHLQAMRTSQGIVVRVGGGVVDVARGVITAPRLA
jgi:trans-2,3-dihydro-3-hydroxyanthranilate isomerase